MRAIPKICAVLALLAGAAFAFLSMSNGAQAQTAPTYHSAPAQRFVPAESPRGELLRQLADMPLR